MTDNKDERLGPPITDEKLAALESAARAAFRGPWVASVWEVECADAECHEDDCGEDHEVHTIEAPDEYPQGGQVVAQVDEADGVIRTPGLRQFAEANAAHIAAASPDVVLALVAEVRALRQSLAVAHVRIAADGESIAELRAEVERLEAENDRLRQDRYDALDARTTCGMSAAEWQMRTGKAERERREARAESDALREQLAGARAAAIKECAAKRCDRCACGEAVSKIYGGTVHMTAGDVAVDCKAADLHALADAPP